MSAHLFPPGLVPKHSNTISAGRAVELEIDLFPTGAQPILNIACTVCSQQGELVYSNPAPSTLTHVENPIYPDVSGDGLDESLTAGEVERKRLLEENLNLNNTGDTR